MATQSNQMYCKATTLNHVLSVNHKDCIEKIGSIVANEGGKNPGFTDEIAINMDKVEATLAKQQGGRNQNPTVDMAFGVKDRGMQKFVLCEYKLKQKGNSKNLQAHNISDKIKYSKSILGGKPPVYRCCLVVHKDKQNSAVSLVRRYFSSKQEVKVLTLQGLLSEYF